MATKASVTDIPNFLEARSAKALRRLMLETNVKFGREFQYFNIQFANGRWYAWYYLDLTLAMNKGVSVDPNEGDD